jgi:drug/metabolite transporter (DMT)-like permease
MFALCLLWSLQQISLKSAAPWVSPLWMLCLRSGIAAVLVGTVMFWRRERVSLQSGRWKPGVVVGVLFALEYLLVAQSLRLTHASHVVVFLYTAPAFAALGLHWRLPAERLHRWQWLGIAIAFTGIALAFLLSTTHTEKVAHDAASVGWGDFLALLAGASWGLTTVTVRCTSLAAAPASETLLYQLLGAFVLLAAAAVSLGQVQFVPSREAWGHLFFQSVVVSFASFLAWFWLLRTYLASRLGVFSFMTPVFGVALGIVLLGEPLESGFLLGTALVLIGILLVSAQAWMPARMAARLFNQGRH